MDCPFCAETIKDEALVSRHCSRDLRVVRPIVIENQNLVMELDQLQLELDRIKTKLAFFYRPVHFVLRHAALYVLIPNGVPAVRKRVFPILIGLLPGIAVGAFVLASLQPGWIKFGTYTVILPLILVQAAGWRRPIRSTWLIGLPFGTALGILYSVTTISGPLCLSEIKLAHTDDEVRQEMA